MPRKKKTEGATETKPVVTKEKVEVSNKSPSPSEQLNTILLEVDAVHAIHGIQDRWITPDLRAFCRGIEVAERYQNGLLTNDQFEAQVLEEVPPTAKGSLLKMREMGVKVDLPAFTGWRDSQPSSPQLVINSSATSRSIRKGEREE